MGQTETRQTFELVNVELKKGTHWVFSEALSRRQIKINSKTNSKTNSKMKGRNKGVKQRDTVLYVLYQNEKNSLEKCSKAYICPIILILHFGMGFGMGFGIHFSFAA